MKWVTRERPKIDRIACPWLILRFIDENAELLYVPAAQVLAVAAQTPPGSPRIMRCCATASFCMTRSMHGARSCRTSLTGLPQVSPDSTTSGFGEDQMRPNTMATAGMTAILMAASAVSAEIDWTRVDQAIGKKGAMQPGGVYKFGLPRSDFKVTVDGVAIKPSLAFGSWVAFLPAGDGAMVMGDLVLTDEEISPVMQRLVDDGLEITAVHNHLLRTSVPVFYMHIGGHGDPVKLARSVHAALSLSKTPLSQPPAAAAPPPLELDTAAIEETLGFKGTANGGVYQFSVPRAEAISAGGMAIPPSMGTAMAINFQPTGGGKAAITGDLVLRGSEVNPIVKTLRGHGIEVTALHSHMIDDSPHLFFMHFWANDDAAKLAEGMRAALDLASVKRGS